MPKTTRESLIEAGARLFAKVGYQRTSIGAIEEEAGLSPRAGGFYRHFKSKEELLLELANLKLETPAKLGLDQILPLGNTRAELIYIARAYDRLNRAGGPLARTIHAEAGRIPRLAKLLQSANSELFTGLIDWLLHKPCAKSLTPPQIGELVFIIFGGWLFFIGRQDQIIGAAQPNPEALLSNWATHWADYLDKG